MKKTLLFLLLLSGFGCVFSQNQNVGIGTTTPDPSAILDLTSTSKGFLAPRVTTVERLAIATPANGLMVYDITVGCYFYYNTGWVSLCQLSGPEGATGANGATGPQGQQGQQGVAGSPGATGPQGLQGVTGAQGVAGPQGPQGVAGPQGVVGAQGVQGVAGPQGPQGVAGPQGANGTTGVTGTDGATGQQGVQGVTGLGGATGAQGLQGVTGADGPTGPQGIEGVTGNDGPTGAQGLQGITGSNGATGTQGVQGVTGAVGATGTQGIQGITGANGATGVQGIQGVTGVNGTAGAQGIQGATGAVGTTGTQGIQGITGATGSQGIQGVTGVVGATGTQGIQGVTGATGSQGIQGVTGVVGATGTQGIQGVTGATGLQGNQGIQGATGTQGIQGTTGASGTQGVTGATGTAGTTGVAGATGAVGATGAAGATGATGFLQAGGVFTMPYYNASTPAWVTTATNIYDNGTNVAIGPVGGTTVATTTEKLTVLGAALNGLNVTTTSTTAGQYALHANGSSYGDAYLGYINPSLTVAGEVIANPAGYFSSSANVPLAAACSGINPAFIAVNSSTTGGQAAYMQASDAGNDGLDVINDAAAGTNDGDGIYSYTAQSVGMALEGWNASTNGTGILVVGNNLSAGFYLPTGSGSAFTGNAIGVFGVQSNGTTAGTNYVNPYAGVYGEDSVISSLGSLKSMYHFGVWGLNYDASGGNAERSGGVLGSTTLSTAFASLAYTNSGDNIYGLYYTSSGTGAGFLPSNAEYGIGSGGTGGVIGSWTRGAVMGQISCGELFASYNLGNSYTSGYQAELVDIGDKRVAAFSVTSPDIKVYGDGNASLQNGTATVKFDASFAAMLGAAPNVTVTPIGESNGLYIVSMDKTGFTVKENKEGQSNIQFTWIAVGNRIDAANRPELPRDLADKSFDANMKGAMFDESDLEHSGTPVWWDGQKVRFDWPNGKVFHAQKPMATASKVKSDKKNTGKNKADSNKK